MGALERLVRETDMLGMRYGTSTKAAGQMKLYDNTDNTQVLSNRKQFFDKQSLNNTYVVSAGTIHSSGVRVVTNKDRGGIIPETDALISNELDVILTVTSADCLPIFCYDESHQTIGIIHAGWRGITAGIIPRTLEALKEAFDTNPEDLRIIIGPHIRSCHFEVLPGVAREFDEFANHIIEKEGSIFINLAGVVTDQLESRGTTAYFASDECTFELPEKYFSFRRDKPQNVEAMISFITL